MHPLELLAAGPYNTLYAGGFVLAFTLAWWQGSRRGWPSLPWLALLGAAAAGGIAGSRLLHFHLVPQAPGAKTILGGLIGGALLLLAAGRFLRFDRAAPDVLAPAALLGLALGRVGCFLAGCCFGLPTALPWGVRYAPGTDPYAAQLAAGVIAPGAAVSLPVHPTQLYEAALTALLVAALWRRDVGLRRPGSRALALAVGYGAIRFGVEFYRAGGEDEMILGLKVLQWLVALVALACAAALLWREARGDRGGRRSVRLGAPATPEGAALLLGGIAAVAALAAGWLTPLERVVLAAALLPAAFLLLRDQLPRMRWAAPGVLAAALLLQIPDEGGRNEPRSYYTLGGSAMTGRYVETCGGHHTYRVAGASVGYTHLTGATGRSALASYSMRGQLFYGQDRDESQDGGFQPPSPRTIPVFGAALTGSVDWPHAGLTVGAIAGELVFDGDVGQNIAPVLGLRVGWPEGFFVEGRLFDHEPSAFPAPGIQLGIGHRSLARGSQVRIGASDAGFYGGGTLVTDGGAEIQPFVGWGGRDTHQFGIALRQRFGPGARPR